jgi:uncharacterized protein (DUF885 family)
MAKDYWEWVLRENPAQRIKLGLRIENLPDISPEKSQSEAGIAAEFRRRLARINASGLTDEDWLTTELMSYQTQLVIDHARFHWLRSLVTPYASPIPVVNQVYRSYQFTNAADLDGYVSLLDQYGAFINSIREHLRRQAANGILLPKAEIALVRPFLSSYIKPAGQSIFRVDPQRLVKLGSGTQSFADRVARIITRQVNPRLQQLVDSLDGEYFARAPDSVGLSQIPGGEAYYRHLVKVHTSLDVTPEQVHRIGLDVVQETSELMRQTRSKLRFSGMPEEFNTFLKTAPKFFPRSPEEIGGRLTYFVSRIAPQLPKMFRRLPRAPYDVRRLDPSLEGAQTFGHYQTPTATEPKGIYYYNGSDLKSRTLLDAAVLIYHELIPGHHLQMNLQSENASLPEFRRYGSFEAYPTGPNLFAGAYTEGWACYATLLADELGMYADPYDYYGYLTMNMFYSVRLVVDTGMNCLGWSRQRATDYMRAHLLQTDPQIATETLRYSTDLPAQALAYRMGARKIAELRDRAKQVRSVRFDIRDFHQWILGSGAMPLSILEKHLDHHSLAVAAR